MEKFTVELISKIAENGQKVFFNFERRFGQRKGGYLAVFSTNSSLLQITKISAGHDFEKESVERKCLILAATPAAISSSQTIKHSKGAVKLNNSLIIGFSCKSMSQDEKELFILAVARSMCYLLGNTGIWYDGDIISIDDILSISENNLITNDAINQLIRGWNYD